MRPMKASDRPKSKILTVYCYVLGLERVSRAEDYACELRNSEFDELKRSAVAIAPDCTPSGYGAGCGSGTGSNPFSKPDALAAAI